jgi:acyl carrier protein
MTAHQTDPFEAQQRSSNLGLQLREQLRELGFMSEGSVSGDEQSLFDAGVLDSLRLMELVARLESRYGIKVEADDLVPDNFETIVGMASYLRGRLERRSGG